MIRTYAIQRLIDIRGGDTNITSVAIARDLMQLDMFSRIRYYSDEIIAALALYESNTDEIRKYDHPSAGFIADLIDGRPSTAKTFVQLCIYLATQGYKKCLD